MTGVVIDTSAIIAILHSEPEKIRFGKGRHPARLNFGDCASYALAQAQNLPLLFKGNDFSQTDICAADHPAR